MTKFAALVGDIGGTNTRLRALYIDEDGNRLIAECTYSSNDYPTFIAVVETFLVDKVRPVAPDGQIVCGCFAFAGPVFDNSVLVTNLKWPTVHGHEVASALNVPRVVVTNDFTAAAYGCITLQPSEVIALHNVPRTPGGPIAVVGPGTGLGEAYLTATAVPPCGSAASAPSTPSPSAFTYTAWASEGGHADYTPHTHVEAQLLRYLHGAVEGGWWSRCDGEALASTSESLIQRWAAEQGAPAASDGSAAAASDPWLHTTVNDSYGVRVSVERVVSGLGIPHLYTFVLTMMCGGRDVGIARSSSQEDLVARGEAAMELVRKRGMTAAEVSVAAIKYAAIIDAQGGECTGTPSAPLPPLEADSGVDGAAALRAMDLFVCALGYEAGDVAVKLLPSGGFFLTGGIPSLVLPLLKRRDALLRCMSAKGRMRGAVERVPVYVVDRSVEVGVRGVELLALREAVAFTTAAAASGDTVASAMSIALGNRLSAVREPFGGCRQLS